MMSQAAALSMRKARFALQYFLDTIRRRSASVSCQFGIAGQHELAQIAVLHQIIAKYQHAIGGPGRALR
ncbi:hypothetical protein CPter291_0566 [Collimonas pratensis]|uniref:Uncharacterized protein n=1 Tax=Collimonas pratensis TaxID=279113 RepID=A0ABM5Z1A9_9BURK|nr:hypothetical protein CPter291_0566 [Collimonas pratensis]